MRHWKLILAILALAVSLLVLSGCGDLLGPGDDSDSDSDGTTIEG